jgi:MYXO-CTERM domain-containing protein
MNMADNDPLSGLVAASAGSRRGVTKVDLLVNGFPWATAKGADFGFTGQLNPSNYNLVYPSTLPDGISDFVVRAYDDLGAFSDSTPITKTKGAPCVTDDTCAQGQRCDAGRCLWDPPTREVGDDCDYPQQCKSLSCVGTDPKICSEECNPDDANTCPNGLSCSELGPQTGVCFPDSGGCCSAADGRAPWGGIATSALVFGLVMRRRRRR